MRHHGIQLVAILVMGLTLACNQAKQPVGKPAPVSKPPDEISEPEPDPLQKRNFEEVFADYISDDKTTSGRAVEETGGVRFG